MPKAYRIFIKDTEGYNDYEDITIADSKEEAVEQFLKKINGYENQDWGREEIAQCVEQVEDVPERA